MKFKILPVLRFNLLLLLIILFFSQACENRKFNDDNEGTIRRSNLTLEEKKLVEAGLKNVRMKKDEFSNFTWYQDKSSPIYVNQNGFFLYFGIKNDGYVTDLKFRIQYCADDWLFIQDYSFIVDSINFSLYTFDSVERDNGNGKIWEWFNGTVSDERFPMIKAISKAKKVKIRFNGRQYYNTRTVTINEIKAVDNILTVYENIQNILSKPAKITGSL